MPIYPDDTFPLWTFGYREKPTSDDPKKITTTRGRTAEEAWEGILIMGGSNPFFKEPEKVGIATTVSIQDKNGYARLHDYDWLHDAPLWLKRKEGRHDLIW
ncbi:MAG: hypothetical protein RL094_404 [Candidatus Parcubacteria bacterium]|jgi:hypothetical protein